jgi:Tfp pilus assembly protein PilF
MSRRFPVLRRLAVASTGITLAAILLRGQISSALVVRGDDLNYRGDGARARLMYTRAIAVDPSNGVAVDRFAFAAVIAHRQELRTPAIRVATAYLRRHPNDSRVLTDRALLYQAEQAYVQACRDFSSAAMLDGDVQAFTFAGFDALHAHLPRLASADFARALASDPHFIPARRGLERVSKWK